MEKGMRSYAKYGYYLFLPKLTLFKEILIVATELTCSQ